MMLSVLTAVTGKLKQNFFILLILILTSGILVFMFLLNDVVINVRLMEFKVFLRMINREDSNIDYLEMVAKYKLHKELYENTINARKFDEEELRLAVFANSTEDLSEITISKYEKLSKVVIPVINSVRLIMNKSPISDYVNDYTDNLLDLAYYYERNKYYDKSLQVYNRILKQHNRVLNEKRPLIILHQGYCYSIVGDYDLAKKKFQSVINTSDNKSVAITAAILLQYVKDFEAEIERVKNSEEGSLEKSEKLFKLIAYKDALDILDEIEVNSEEEAEKIKYYKARCFEETGKKDESVKLYQEIILENHDSQFAKLSNRRILVSSSIDDSFKELKKLAKKNDTLIKDQGFEELFNKTEDLDKLKAENKADKEDGIKEAVTIDAELTNIIEDKNEISMSIVELDNFIVSSAKNIEEKKLEIIYEEEKKAEELVTLVKPTPIKKIVKEVAKKEDKAREKLLENPVYREIEETLPDDLTTDLVYEEDKEGNKIDGSYSIYHKDPKGTIYKAEQYDNSGNILNVYIYEYDDAGNPITVNVYDANGNLKDFF